VHGPGQATGAGSSKYKPRCSAQRGLNAAPTTVITRPSKTADIEGVLVTGVYGPAAVEIVLVD
jgi:L-lactate utilization protein LutC